MIFKKVQFTKKILSHLVQKNAIQSKLICKTYVNLDNMGLNEFSEKHNNTILKSKMEMDKEIIYTMCNVNLEMQIKKSLISEEKENYKKDYFTFDVDYLHECKLEELLNYYLYNHENFNNDQLDYFLYLFCVRSELTNKIYIKTKNLDQHKAITLIWDFFLKNYKKIDNIDECNKFFYLYYIYFKKFSMNKDDFLGKFFNKNNKKFFLNTIEKYLTLSINETSTGKLINIITLLGSLRIVNYYEFLKNREDDLDKLPYWTLRRLIVRVNSDLKNEKNLRQLLNLLINPLIRDFTSIDTLEKSYLLKNICIMDKKIILLSSLTNLKNQLIQEIQNFVDLLPENFDLNNGFLKIFINFCQAAKNYEKILEDERMLNSLDKLIGAFENFEITEMVKDDEIEKKNNIILDEYIQDMVKNTNSSTNVNKSKDFNNESIDADNNFLENKYTIKNDNLKNVSKLERISDELFFEEIEELNDLELKLRVIKKNEENDELDFLDAESFEGKDLTNKIEQDIFKTDSNLKKFFEDVNNKGQLKEENDINKKSDENNEYFNSSKLKKIEELITSDNFDKIENNFHKDIEDTDFSSLNFKITEEELKNNFSDKNLNQEILNKIDDQFEKPINNSLNLGKINSIGYFFLLILNNIVRFKNPSFSKNRDLAIRILAVFKRIIFKMDINLLKEKIQVNLIFSVFTLMNNNNIGDKDIFNFLLENFSEKMVDNILFESYIDFIHWNDKFLSLEERKTFIDKTTKALLTLLSKDFSLYNFLRVVSLICSINRKRTVLTDNLHFELISLIDIECNIEVCLKLFSDYIKSVFEEVHIDYNRNLLSFLLHKIKIKDFNLISNEYVKIEFYFALLTIDTKIFDPEFDKVALKQYYDIINYLESLPFFELEFFIVIKFFYRSMERFKNESYQRALEIFFRKMEKRIRDNSILLDLDVDRFCIYFALSLIQKQGNILLIKKAVELCDLIYEKNKKHLDLNFTESISGLEKLLEKNIFCKSLIKNFLVNIQIFKRLKDSNELKLDDQSNFDINLINFKFQNIEKNKDLINDLLENLRENEIISQDLFNISVFK